jgi:hypothetical protein
VGHNPRVLSTSESEVVDWADTAESPLKMASIVGPRSIVNSVAVDKVS